MAADKNGKKLPTGIRKKSENSYEVRVKHDGKTYYEYASTITEAKKKRVDLKYQLTHGTYIKPATYTFDEWFNFWIKNYKENSVKIGTIQTYKNYYNSCVKERFGDVKIDKIKGADIQAFYNDLTKKGRKLSTIKVVKAFMSSCLKQAVKDELIARNPFDATSLPRKAGDTMGRIAMTREEQELFMEYAKESFLYNLFAVMLRTGMRSGEARDLRWSDIDKKQNVIHVTRTLQYINGVGFIDDAPKTKTSIRDIPLTAEVLKLLENQKNYWGFKVEKIDRYLFCDADGNPVNVHLLQAEIDKTIKRIHEDGKEFPRITSHVFRHTFATRAIEAGMQPQVLKTIMGHSSLAMTMDLYSHVLPDTKAEEMQKIANVF